MAIISGSDFTLDDIARIDPRQASSVYGPVKSWRVGRSLGIDLLLLNSICSFNCVYCQLGDIQVRTNDRRVFVPTDKVLEDLRQAPWQDCDIVTFSGNGEPTLAANLGEAVKAAKDLTGKPVLVLTNGSLLDDPQVRRDLCFADRVFVKLDAASADVFRRFNRPVEGVRLSQIVEGAQALRSEFSGYLGVQIMFLPPNLEEAEAMIPLLRRIRPDEVQVNTPTRPHPREWRLKNRSGRRADPCNKVLKPLPVEQLEDISRRFRQATGLQVVSVYDRLAEEGRE
ncbi:MAG TPA: radical SAM protein [Acidobacteriota bacterium]|nr:radical SAM protein [Acidobacteriota bacterium]